MKTASYSELWWTLQGMRGTRLAHYAQDSVKMWSKASGEMERIVFKWVINADSTQAQISIFL